MGATAAMGKRKGKARLHESGQDSGHNPELQTPVSINGYHDAELAECAVSRVNRWCPSEWWFGRKPPLLFVECGACPKSVPAYYLSGRYRHCEDCTLAARTEWLQALEEWESRPWASQTARMWAMMKRLGIPYEWAEAIALRVDRLDRATRSDREKRRDEKRVFYHAAAENLQDRPIAGIDTEALAAEQELFELTGWINEDDVPSSEVKKRLYFTKVLRQLTHETVSGLTSSELRCLILEVRCDLESAGVEPDLPKDYTDAPYPDE